MSDSFAPSANPMMAWLGMCFIASLVGWRCLMLMAWSQR